ncbi:hypothetical protein ACFLXC_06555 [Chloroflexota bacterium]
MGDEKRTIVESWPGLREDLKNFLADTDAWIIFEFKKALEEKDWDSVQKVIDVMETVHNLSHAH